VSFKYLWWFYQSTCIYIYGTRRFSFARSDIAICADGDVHMSGSQLQNLAFLDAEERWNVELRSHSLSLGNKESLKAKEIARKSGFISSEILRTGFLRGLKEFFSVVLTE